MNEKLNDLNSPDPGRGAPFDESLPSAGMREDRPSRQYRPPSFPQQLADELAQVEKERARVAEQNIYLAHKLRVARVFGNELAVRVISALLLWGIFHACLWSWQRSAPMAEGQQAYQYLSAAIRKGALPTMDRLASMPDAGQPATPANQPAPPPAK